MWYSFDIHCTVAKSNCMVRDVQKTLKSQWIIKMQNQTIYLHWKMSVVFLASKTIECCFIWSWNVTKEWFYAKIAIEIDHFDEQNCLKIVKIIFFCIPSKLKSRNLSQNTYHGSDWYNQHIKECFKDILLMKLNTWYNCDVSNIIFNNLLSKDIGYYLFL